MDPATPPFQLTASTSDDVISALVGNGSMATTLCPTGFHVPPTERTEEAHITQQFTWAGRRRGAPRYTPINMGSVWRELLVNGNPTEVRDWSQTLEPRTGVVMSEWDHKGLTERTRSWLSITQNLFCADTVLTNDAEEPLEVSFTVSYQFGEPDANVVVVSDDDRFSLEVECAHHLFGVEFLCVCESGGVVGRQEGSVVTRYWSGVLEPGGSLLVTTALQFVDRESYRIPIHAGDLEREAEDSESICSRSFEEADIQFSNEEISRSVYLCRHALESQATPWTIPETLSVYKNGAYSASEVVPLMALLALGRADLLIRALQFRQETLTAGNYSLNVPRYVAPHWATESGSECAPLGRQLSARQCPDHLVEMVWQLYLTSGDPKQASNFNGLLELLHPWLHRPRTVWIQEQLERLSRNSASLVLGAKVGDNQSHKRPDIDVFNCGSDTETTELGFIDMWDHKESAGSLAAASRFARFRAEQGDGQKAWEILKHGLNSFGVGPCPVEWKDTGGEAHVPWSTVAAGHWLLAVCRLFVRMDDDKTVLLPAVPPQCEWATFHGLAAGCGVRVSGRVEKGQVVSLSAVCDKEREWQFCIPKTAVSEHQLVGEVVAEEEGFQFVRQAVGREPVSLLK